MGDPNVGGAAALVGVGHDQLTCHLVHSGGDVGEDPVVGVGQQPGGRVKNGCDRGAGAPRAATVGGRRGHGLVVLKALLVGCVDPGVVHGAVRADIDPGVLVELVAFVADRDRPGPVPAVVVRERDLDR